MDGVYVGYNKVFEKPRFGDFEGFLKAGGKPKPVPAAQLRAGGRRMHPTSCPQSPPPPKNCSADAHGTAYQSFVFSKPVETAAKQVTGLNFQEGSIRCQVGTRSGPCSDAAAAPPRRAPTPACPALASRCTEHSSLGTGRRCHGTMDRTPPTNPSPRCPRARRCAPTFRLPPYQQPHNPLCSSRMTSCIVPGAGGLTFIAAGCMHVSIRPMPAACLPAYLPHPPRLAGACSSSWRPR